MAEVTTTWPVFQLRRTLLVGAVLAVVGLGLAAVAIAIPIAARIAFEVHSARRNKAGSLP